MRLITSILLVSLWAITATQAQSNNKRKDPDTFVNLDKQGVIIRGYDAVAFFTQNKAVKGSSDFKSTYKGAIYQFATKDNKALFDANPEMYKVQFGGWCAYAVSKGGKAPIDINTWSIQNGRLIFQYNQRIAKIWSGDPDSYLEKADQNWPKVAGRF